MTARFAGSFGSRVTRPGSADPASPGAVSQQIVGNGCSSDPADDTGDGCPASAGAAPASVPPLALGPILCKSCGIASTEDESVEPLERLCETCYIAQREDAYELAVEQRAREWRSH